MGEAGYRELLRESWRRRRAAGIGGGRRGRGGSGPAAPRGADRPGPARRLRQRVHTRLLRDLEAAGDVRWRDPEAQRARVRELLDLALGEPGAPLLRPAERRHVEAEVMAEVRGLGPLEPLFDDPTVSDILINGPREVWVDRFGRLERTRVAFDDEAHLRRLLARLVAAHGRHLDEGSPSVDVRLTDGSRLHAVIPPLSAAPVVSIRRLRRVPFRIEELYECGTMTPAMGELLGGAVDTGLNLVISGGAASGKTTLLNVLSSFIPAGERVITIEETAELRLDHPHVVALEARLPNIEGRGEVSLRGLVRNALRMRPDRIIVGEVRGPEVFDMLQAMNTGHQGSMTTVHANGPDDALRRLENLVHLGGFDLPSGAIRELLGSAFELLVHTSRFADGTRRITGISEVLLTDGRLTTGPLFEWREQAGGGGEHADTGTRPTFFARLAGGSTDPTVDAGDRGEAG